MPTIVRRLVPLVLGLLLVLAAAPSVGAASASYPTQSRGNRGADVKTIEGLLRHHGATVMVDGVFDDALVTAVKAFQEANGLTPDGRVGASTWVKLRVTLQAGDEGEAVKALQRQLNEKRLAKLELTGTFDGATTSAVRAFQKHAHLDVTGIASPTTWRALIAHFELPVWGKRMCDYSVGNGAANWGTGAAIGQLQAAADVVVAKGHGRVALGDVSLQHGGDIPGHQFHEHGLEADLRPMRDGKDQCTWGVNWRWSTYDRAATRDLIRAIRATAPGHVRLIYFNDPVLIDEGLTRWHSGHDDHLHVRYCEKVHPVSIFNC